MATSLAKFVSKFCIQVQKVIQPLSILPSNFAKLTTLKNTKSLHSLTLSSTKNELKSPNYISKRAFHTTPVCPTTYELKQWREHRVINRFYRLHWGAWIRCFGGRHKRLYLKTPARQLRLKQHVFVTAKQSKLLDTLVTPKWREPKYFADSPYEPYHTRTNCKSFPNHRKFYP